MEGDDERVRDFGVQSIEDEEASLVDGVLEGALGALVKSEYVDVVSNVAYSDVKTFESKHESVDVKNKGVYSTEETKPARKNNFSPLIIEHWNSDDESEIEFVPKVEGNPQQKEYMQKGVIDSGCSRHMTGNKCYLYDYEDYDGGFVSFGDGKGRIPGKGIKREFSVTRTPQQNGVAKRKNKTLIEATRTMLVDSKFPTTFWAEVVNTACYVLNMALFTKPHNKIPYELIHERPPPIDFMKPFGCPITILNTKDSLGKFDGKLMTDFLLLVAGKQTNGIAGTKDSIVTGPKDSVVDTGKKATEVDESLVLENGGHDDQVIRSEFEGILQQESQTKHVNSTNSFNTIVLPVNTAGPSFANTASPSQINAAGTPAKVDMNNVVLSYIIPDAPITKFLKDYPKDQTSGQLVLNGVFRNKKDKRGIVVKNKARLVAQGHTQEECIDYDEIFAPVATIKAIRLFLAYASFKDFVIYPMDVKSAFLYGKIEAKVYVCQPPGFKDPNLLDKVYKVEKALYGLHQALRACQEKYMANILKKFDFTTMKTASTLIEPNKALVKDAEAEDVDVYLYRLMIGSLMYLTASRLDITFAVCASLVDGKKIIINEASIRRDLRLDDVKVPKLLPGMNSAALCDMSHHKEIFINPSLTKKVFANMKRVGTGFSRVITPLFETMMVQAPKEVGDIPTDTQDNPFLLNHHLLNHNQEGNRYLRFLTLSHKPRKEYLHLLMIYYPMTNQASKIEKLKKRVKKLERKKKKRNHGLKRLYKVELSARVESSKDEEGLDQRRIKDQDLFGVYDLDGDEVFVDVTTGEDVEQDAIVAKSVEGIAAATALQISKDELTLAQTLMEIKAAKPKAKWNEANRAIIKEWNDVYSTIDADRKLAEQIQAQEREQLYIEERSKLLAEIIESRRKYFAGKRVEEIRNKPPIMAHQKSLMCTYMKNIKGFKQKDFKGKSFDDIKKMFDKVYKRVNTFMDMNTENVDESLKKTQEQVTEGSSKRARQELEQESAKKQKLEQAKVADDDTIDMKRCLEIVPEDDVDVEIKVTPISSKSPTIVDYKIYIEGKKSYIKIIRADGNSQNYVTFGTMFKNFNREDLEVLRSIVKERFKKTKQVDDMENLLFQTLKTMFEPHVEDIIWKYQQGAVKVNN
nr:hypothetical protein [Tanacetum cinerariifolium]